MPTPAALAARAIPKKSFGLAETRENAFSPA
jgi:hypothetical protein